MVHNAKFMSDDEDATNNRSRRQSNIIRRSKGALIGVGTGLVGGVIGGRIWNKENRKLRDSSEKDYRNSMTKDQKSNAKDIRITERHLQNQADIAQGLGSLAGGPVGKMVGGSLASIANRKEHLSLARKKQAFRESLTKEQKDKIKVIEKQGNKAALKAFVSTLGGMVVGGVAGHYIAKGTEKKYSDTEYALPNLKEKLEKMKAKKKAFTDKKKEKLESFLKYVVVGKR